MKNELKTYEVEVQEISSAFYTVEAHSYEEAMSMFDAYLETNEGSEEVSRAIEYGYQGYSCVMHGETDAAPDLPYEYLAEILEEAI